VTSNPLPPSSPGVIHCPRVLLADDDQGTRELVGACVARAGWHLEATSSGRALVDKLQQQPFDVVVVDLLMPGIDGISLLKQIKARRPGQAVILISKSGNIGDFVAFMKEGVLDVLQKPVDSDTLQRTVARVLSSVRERERALSIYRFVTREVSEFSFATSEIAECRMPLTLLDRLMGAGILEIQSKLKLELAFQEALANAVEHGNLELQSSWKEEFDSEGIDRFSLVKRERLADDTYARRRVTITISFDGFMLSIAIRDNGKGFTPHKRVISNPNAEVPHGRGLAIIYAAVDEVRYSESGTEIEMLKRLPG
jgi:FixJ family two-component response regulator/anti-sigma regulatory factor (Ser/Thr protein kinase)